MPPTHAHRAEMKTHKSSLSSIVSSMKVKGKTGLGSSEGAGSAEEDKVKTDMK